MDRIPPYSIESEQALLGAALLSPHVFADVIGSVSEEDFYKPAHQFVFSAMRALWLRGTPIDAVAVADELQRHGLLDDVGGTGLLVDLMSAVPAVSRAQHYAEAIVRTSRLRAMLGSVAEISDLVYEAGADPDSVFDKLCSITGDKRLMPREIHLPEDYMKVRELRDLVIEDEGSEWIVQSLLRKRWRVLVVGTEGSGKSTLFRQFATLVANGMHPLVGGTHKIVPRRALIIDAENPLDVVQSQFDLVDDLAQSDLSRSENLWIWREEGGMNLRDRTTQMKMEAVLADCQPELVTMGPLYKMFRIDSTDQEQATVEMLTVLDGFRKRYGFALLVEHHAPQGDGSSRDIRPRGSATLLGWPEFGIKLVGQDRDWQARPRIVELGRFRGDRVDANWPGRLTRGMSSRQEPPWVGDWSGTNRATTPRTA